MGKIEEKMINTFSWIVKGSAITFLFIVMIRSYSVSATRTVPNTTGCQCAVDTLPCKRCKEQIRMIVKEELDKQLLEVFD